MWTAKISFDGSRAFIGSRTLKYKLNIFAFPLSYFYQKNWIIVNVAGLILGENKKNRANFLKDIKNTDRVVNIELNNDFFILTLREPLFAKTLYNSEIIHLAPALIDEKGQETITIGCFERKNLNKALATLEKTYQTKIHYIQEKKITNISIVKQVPELTEKQKKAIELAIKNGYYDYPRKISIEQLAKLSKLSFSTFHAHLRKAEHKLMPFYFER